MAGQKNKSSIEDKKKQLLEALEECLGNIKQACKKVGLSRRTYYNYYKDDLEFRDQCDDVAEEAIDHVESKLFDLINGVKMVDQNGGELNYYRKEPNTGAVIFYLKTKAKHRGYVEQQNINPVAPQKVVIEASTTEEKERAETIMKTIKASA